MDLDVAELATLTSALYLLILAFAALDAVVPVVPSEGALVVGAVLAARGDLELPLVVAAGAVGALTGDLASYGLGCTARRRRRGREPAGRLGGAVRWARRLLDRRGPGVLVVARFIPGGRTATTFTSGFVGYPAAAFTASVAVGATLWAAHGTAIGYLGGHLFADNVALGIVAGIAMGVAGGLLVEAVRSRLHRRRVEA